MAIVDLGVSNREWTHLSTRSRAPAGSTISTICSAATTSPSSPMCRTPATAFSSTARSRTPAVHSIPLTTEEEGVALIAGADLGGARAVLLMQSSGVGNCINMLSLIKGGRFPFLALISMRGDFGEGNPWQFPMGQAVEPVLGAMGVICVRIERPEEVVPTAGAALTMVFQSGNAVAV